MDVLPSPNESPRLEIMSEPYCGLELTKGVSYMTFSSNFLLFSSSKDLKQKFTCRETYGI